MLSDSWIRDELNCEEAENRLVIEPAPEDVQIQPASVDLRLGGTFKTFVTPLGDPSKAKPIDVTAALDPSWMETQTITQVDGADAFYQLDPGVFTLATTIERVRIPRHLAARVEGKSSLGRIGLLVHATAGFIDPGFEGTITLEMTNLSPRPILLKLGMKICQLSLYKMMGRVERPYGHPSLQSRYQGQTGTTESRIKEST